MFTWRFLALLAHSKPQTYFFRTANPLFIRQRNVLTVEVYGEIRSLMSSGHSSNMNVKSSAVKALAMEYKNLLEEPLEGFQVKLSKEDCMFEWDVVIFGPPETLYQGGYFKAKMRFPLDYPFSPPSVKFLTKVWHPNIYDSGDICISILHPPVEDPQSGELPCERWNPTQTVRTILLSVVSLLNEPNTFSPANVDASVMYRRWRESKGTDKEYEEIIRRQVAATREEAVRDGVEVPSTLEDYTRASRMRREKTSIPPADISDFFEDITGDDDGDDNDTDQDTSGATSQDTSGVDQGGTS